MHIKIIIEIPDPQQLFLRIVIIFDLFLLKLTNLTIHFFTLFTSLNF